MKRLGPELKMPQKKVPPVLVELFEDLRDRRLLPLLGLVAVAIVAVPFLLSEGAEETVSPSADVPQVGQDAAQASALRVVQATPGIRDYRRRLKRRSATDPFHQHYTSPVLKGADLPSQSQTVESSSSSTSDVGGGSTASPFPSGGSGAPAEPTSPDDVTDDGRFRVYTFTIKVQISRTEEDERGNVTMGEPTVRDGVRPLTPLPGEKAPVVTYLGANIETGKAIFMISKDVTAAFGDAKCISGTDSCELMEVEKGFPQTFEYGPNKVRYKFNVIKVDIARAGKS